MNIPYLLRGGCLQLHLLSLISILPDLSERGSVACLLIAICRPEPLRSLLSRLQPSRGKMRGEGVRKKKDKEKGRTFFFSQLSMVIFDSRFPVIDDKVCLRKEEHTFCFVLPPLAPPFHPDSPASQSSLGEHAHDGVSL